MQPIPFSRLKVRQQLHFRVGDVPLAFVQVGLAVNDDLLLHRQIPQDPLGAPEPLELHCPFAVVKHRDQSAPSGATHFLGLGDDTLHLDGSMLALNVHNAVKLAAVFVPKRQVQEQVHARPNAQLRNKGVGPFGPDAFEKFYRVDGSTSAMVTASYVPSPVRPTSRRDSPSFA